MFKKRSNRTQERIVIEQLLDVVGRCLQDVDGFCLTGLDVTIQDTRDIRKVANEVGSQLGFRIQIRRREALKPKLEEDLKIPAQFNGIMKAESARSYDWKR